MDLSPAPWEHMHGRSLDQWWSNCIRDEVLRKAVRGIVRDRGQCGERLWGFERFDEWYKTCEKGWLGPSISNNEGVLNEARDNTEDERS